MTQPESSCWKPSSIMHLRRFERSRELTIRATRRLFEKFHDEHFERKSRVLEIGAGLGFMRRNWPGKYTGRWIETDEQPAFLDNRECTQQASAYELPFESRSFDIVCGFSSFDVFHDLETALRQVDRVLRPGGLFFHMLDMEPSNAVSARWNERTNLPVSVEGIWDGNGYGKNETIRYLPKERLEHAERLMAQNPENFARIWSRYSRILDTHELFREDLVSAMRGFFPQERIKSGMISEIYKGPRTETQQPHGGNYTFVNDAFYTGGSFPSMILYHLSRFRDRKGMKSLFQTLNPVYNLELLHRNTYEIAGGFSKKLAEKIEPLCTEISKVHYVLARKSS
ncbi:Methyltransferase domain protein [Candidatus Burarchaeum australiense]|nr:Methyltransferase domain protein [Candidatus Burarchaeum australiense]